MTEADGARASVVELEERFWLEGGGDPEFWREHFADDGVVALPFGLMDKAQTVEAMAQGEPWAHVRMEDLRVVAVDDAAHVVSYRAEATREGIAEPYCAVVGSVYRRRRGEWQLVFHQQSPAADPPGA